MLTGCSYNFWWEFRQQSNIKLSNKPNYNDERLLLAELDEYEEEYLRFLTDFDDPFDNNQSKRGARYFKQDES
ncbi:MAG TPA: hypothetical protein PKI30_05340 [Bacillota bacterium]|nr:hypothetical protein [Bacillota bacterium]